MTSPSPIPPELEAAARAVHDAGVRRLIAQLEQEAAGLAPRKPGLATSRDAHSPAPPGLQTDRVGGPIRTRHLRNMLRPLSRPVQGHIHCKDILLCYSC